MKGRIGVFEYGWEKNIKYNFVKIIFWFLIEVEVRVRK